MGENTWAQICADVHYQGDAQWCHSKRPLLRADQNGVSLHRYKVQRRGSGAAHTAMGAARKRKADRPARASEGRNITPPVDNQVVTQRLVEIVDGKAVTTSRKLAEVLGRKHDSILETIKSNLHKREFKYGPFTARDYSTGACGHGYEFLITRKGLDALASVMRYNAKERIAQAYEGAWDGDKKLLPVPASVAAPEACREDVDDTIRELVKWIDELRVDLRKARVTAKTYAEMYSGEKAKRCRSENREAYWHDLYEDLMLRVQCVKDADEVIDAHVAFKKRLLAK